MTTTTTAPDAVQFSAREVPWMKLGRLVDEPTSAAEAAKLGGLDFTVEKRPISFGEQADLPDSELWSWHQIKERSAIVRTDTNTWLGIMSKDYPILQYSEAFDFVDQISPTYLAAGALKKGRQGFIVARAPEALTLLSDVDPHDVYVVLRTSHDGSRAIEVMLMPLRHRCMNQLTLRSFAANVPHRWAVTHTSNMLKKLADAQTVIARHSEYSKSLATTAQRLIKYKITTDDVAREVLKASLPDRPRRDDQVDKIVDLWHNADTVGFDWTGWGLVNAASEYFDWSRAGGSAESRFVGALQGDTHKVINRVAGRLLSRS